MQTKTKVWRPVLAAAALLISSHSGQAQQVYKWVDANGKTHYGSQPPDSGKDAEALKLQGGGTSGARKPGELKPISKDTRELMQGMEIALKKLDPKTVPLSCTTAVDNVQSQTTTMLETGQRNVQQGYVKSADYEGVASKIRQAKAGATLSDCESSTGNKKMFYQCMSNNRNHVSGCGSAYKF
jgi:hypothetical protein